jgi:type I restriction enzyme, S subunit
VKFNKKCLDDICDIQMGKTPSRSNPDYWGEDYDWISIADLNQGKYIFNTKEKVSKQGQKYSKGRIVKPCTLLMSFKLSIGKLAFTTKETLTNEAIVSLEIKDNNLLYKHFLYYALQNIDFTGGGNRAVMGATLNKNSLKQIQIPLPPLETQKKIADILDKADSIRKKRREAIDKLDELLKSIFLDMFGDPVTNPKGWESEKLENLCGFITKGTTPKSSDIYDSYDKDLIPFIKVYHICNDGTLDFNYKPSYISKKIHKSNLKRSKVLPEDILMNIVGPPLGKICIVPDTFVEWNVNQAIAIFRCGSKLEPGYLLTVLKNTGFCNEIIKMSAGIRQQNLSLEQCRSINIPLPSFSLQKEFVYRLVLIMDTKQKMQQELEQADNLFNSLMQRAFKGELV